MPIYVSMLRGINVGAHKRIKMTDLQRSFETLGCEQVKTYIQSGNVVFRSKLSARGLTGKIEQQLADDFGFSVSVVIRTVEEMCAIVDGNPFLKREKRAIDPARLHVMFLSDTLGADALKKLADLTTAPDQCRCVGNHIYLYLPNGVAGSMLMKRPLEHILAVTTTTRNWRTVTTLHHMCKDCA